MSFTENVHAANDVDDQFVKVVNIGNPENIANWYGPGITKQTAANHTTSTLDVGADLKINAGQCIAWKQAGDTSYRYGYVKSYSAGVVTLIGEAAAASTALTALRVSDLIRIPAFLFSSGINDVSTDLWVAETRAPYYWQDVPCAIVGLIHIAETADATDGGDLNATVNGGSDVFSSDSTVDDVAVDTGITAQSANNRIERGDTLEITTTAPGTGDQAALSVWVLAAPLIWE